MILLRRCAACDNNLLANNYAYLPGMVVGTSIGGVVGMISGGVVSGGPVVAVFKQFNRSGNVSC